MSEKEGGFDGGHSVIVFCGYFILFYDEKISMLVLLDLAVVQIDTSSFILIGILHKVVSQPTCIWLSANRMSIDEEKYCRRSCLCNELACV